jgi:hydroxymethylpyrimidine/phosphomethylpyrimidine kinase
MGSLAPVVACIGTTHPLNIAGLGLPLRVSAALGVRAVTVVAGVSAQTAARVYAREPVAPSAIAAQFAALADAQVTAFHVGALLDEASVRAVARGLTLYPNVPVICDPVIATSGGDALADGATLAALRDELFGLCALITPNLAEAGLLLGMPVTDVPEMDHAARVLLLTGARGVLIKGGHLGGDAIDVLAYAQELMHFAAPRIAAELRGTGDLLAFAIAARLACGDALPLAIGSARDFVRTQLRNGVTFAGAQTIP